MVHRWRGWQGPIRVDAAIKGTEQSSQYRALAGGVEHSRGSRRTDRSIGLERRHVDIGVVFEVHSLGEPKLDADNIDPGTCNRRTRARSEQTALRAPRPAVASAHGAAVVADPVALCE